MCPQIGDCYVHLPSVHSALTHLYTGTTNTWCAKQLRQHGTTAAVCLVLAAVGSRRLARGGQQAVAGTWWQSGGADARE
jgi:hypothetical protein